MNPILALALAVLVVAIPAVADDSTVPAGQTEPSAYYLRDDVQFFPAGPEFGGGNAVAAPAPVAAAPAAADEQRFSLNVAAGVHNKFGLHVAFSFEDKVRGIDVPNVTIPLTLLVRPRIESVAAFSKWYLEREEEK
jgi:hypothetical protein